LVRHYRDGIKLYLEPFDVAFEIPDCCAIAAQCHQYKHTILFRAQQYMLEQGLITILTVSLLSESWLCSFYVAHFYGNFRKTIEISETLERRKTARRMTERRNNLTKDSFACVYFISLRPLWGFTPSMDVSFTVPTLERERRSTNLRNRSGEHNREGKRKQRGSNMDARFVATIKRNFSQGQNWFATEAKAYWPLHVLCRNNVHAIHAWH
jgi:hypothetical protein